MESSSRVVEFFGFPGCGKTTLCNNLKAKMKAVSVGLWEDVKVQYLSLPFFEKLRYVPLGVLFDLMGLFFSTKKLPFRNRRIYWDFFKRMIFYSYACKNKVYDYVFVDHGFAQCLHSFFLGREEESRRPRAVKCMTRLFNKLKPYRIVYCDVTIDTAIQRIKTRNTPNHSRLDKVSDEAVLRSILEKQHVFFSDVIGLFGGVKSGIIFELDANQEQSVVADDTLNIL